MNRLICPNHGPVPPAYSVGSPLTLGVTSAALIFHVSKGNAIAALLAGLVGFAGGVQIAKYCPKCGAELVEVLGDLDEFAG